MSAHNVVHLCDYRLLPDSAAPIFQAWAADGALYWRDFAERLRRSRVLRGISEKKAAAALCVSVKTYRKWETGQRHRDNHYGISNFASTFGISLNWLIAGIGTP